MKERNSKAKAPSSRIQEEEPRPMDLDALEEDYRPGTGYVEDTAFDREDYVDPRQAYAEARRAARTETEAGEAETDDDFEDDDEYEDADEGEEGEADPVDSAEGAEAEGVDEEDDADGEEPEVQSGNKKGYDPERQIRNLSQITHDPNDSSRRKRKRTKLNKIKERVAGGGNLKKRRRGDKGGIGLEFNADYDNRSDVEEYRGHIQVLENGLGFMRSEKCNFLARDMDIVIPKEMVHRYGLRTGHEIEAFVRLKRNRKQKVVTHLISIQGEPIETWRPAPYFQTLTSVNPFEFYHLSTPSDPDKSMALLELLTPIGKGQRGLIVAPPRTGKTMLMEKIANGIAKNHPEAEIIVLLIDERPEEVTHMTRKVNGKIYASCLDKPIEEHISLCHMVSEMAQRKIERGKDVVILLDSITRMARAYNNQLKSSGRTLSGGVDAKALMEPKKFFGAARKIEEGGSLTIIATALVQTGSQMDEVIFQEFKGTGNMELVLNRRMAEKRIYPAIDIGMSGTRREELILPPEFLKAANRFRRYLSNLTEANQMPAALQAMEKYKSSAEFIQAFV